MHIAHLLTISHGIICIGVGWVLTQVLTPSLCEQTHICKNLTFPQLRWQKWYNKESNVQVYQEKK